MRYTARILFILGIFLFVIFKPTPALTVTQITINKQVVSPGEVVKIIVGDMELPSGRANKGYNLFLYEALGTSGSSRLESSIEIVLKMDGTCDSKPSRNWSNVICQKKGNFFELSANYQIGEAEKIYKADLQETSTAKVIYSLSFQVKKEGVQESTVGVDENGIQIFSIVSVEPSPVNAGGTVKVNLANANGNYEIWIDPRDKQNQLCAEKACTLTYKIPGETRNPIVNLYVKDSKGNEKSFTLNIVLAAPTPAGNCSANPKRYIAVNSLSNDCLIRSCPSDAQCDARPLTGPIQPGQPNCGCYGFVTVLSPDLESRCNTSININNLAECNPQVYKKATSAENCQGDSGYVCKDTDDYLCKIRENGNVMCEKPRPIAQPCLRWVDSAGKKIDPPPDPDEIVSKGASCAEIDTSIGEISTDPIVLIKKIFGIILSLSGGIALLLIMYSGYNFMMSQGDPEKVKGAKETLTSAIVGLLFIIFSMVILQIIGVDILQIPGIAK